MRALRLLLGFSFLLFAATSLLGQSTDRHLTSDQAHALYEHSAYAHGYIHGYEDGFHDADMDLHMGRGERPLSVQKNYRDSCDGYRSGFGDKQYFRLGFKQGFREGYSDSIRGMQFRAIDETRKAADGFGESTAAGIKEREFDQAFSRGYDAGRDRGSSAQAQSAEFDHAANLCDSQLRRVKEANQSQSCDAFIRGFALGFGDGEVSRVRPRTQTAHR